MGILKKIMKINNKYNFALMKAETLIKYEGTVGQNYRSCYIRKP